jgi:hypothetical protein
MVVQVMKVKECETRGKNEGGTFETLLVDSVDIKIFDKSLNNVF